MTTTPTDGHDRLPDMMLRGDALILEAIANEWEDTLPNTSDVRLDIASLREIANAARGYADTIAQQEANNEPRGRLSLP